jgi:hypothetical protein
MPEGERRNQYTARQQMAGAPESHHSTVALILANRRRSRTVRQDIRCIAWSL